MKIDYDSIICFAGGDWWYHLPHSYNHLMKEFSNEKKVLYINSLPIGSLGGGSGASKRFINKLKSYLKYFKKAQNNLYVLTPIFIPARENRLLFLLDSLLLHIQISIFKKMLGIKKPLIWVTNPSGWLYCRYVRRGYIMYQIVDKVSEYRHAGRSVAEFDRMLCEKADIIITPGHKIFDEKNSLHPGKVFRIKHGVDSSHFSRKAFKKPDDFPNDERPVFTYWGSVDYKKVDYKLVKHLAENVKNVNFLFIGRIFDFPASDFSGSGNVHFIGGREYGELPDYAWFSYGFIVPWDSTDEMNRNASPIKVREYMSTGKPIVTTYIPEFDEYSKLIYISKSNKEFSDNIKKALNEKEGDLSLLRKAFIEKSSWRNVFEEIRRITSLSAAD